MHTFKLASGVLSIALLAALPACAKLLPGLAELSGNIPAAKSAIVPVYIFNTEKHVGYSVFAVDGKYRAVDLFPGHYEITLRKSGFDMEPVKFDIAAGAHAKADLAPKIVPAEPNYVRGNTIKDVLVEPFDKIYPPGPGRDVIQRTCMVCHGPNFLANRFLDREGWDAAINYMTKGAAFTPYGIVSGPSMFPPSWLSDEDRKNVLDYLEKNLGPRDLKQRAVQVVHEPPMDKAALSKAQFIEYRMMNTKEQPRRWTQEVSFGNDGNVYTTDRGRKPAAIVKVDPRTGEMTDYLQPGPRNKAHGLTVDFDNTVWWAGEDLMIGHLDPKTNLTDQYTPPSQGIYGQSLVWDSKGNGWFSMLLGNKVGYYDRAKDQISYWEDPEGRARPYGLVIDHNDRPWWAEYHTGYIGTIDPVTHEIKRYPIKSQPANMHRLGVDQNNIIWYGVYGNRNKTGALGRLDPKTGETKEWDMPDEWSNPYDAQEDEKGNIWVNTDNYFVRFNMKTEKMTVYPTPERTDMPKAIITRDGAIWYAPRNAGSAGYGACACVFYPDKDNIPTLAAYHSATSSYNYISKAKNVQSVKVTGVIKPAPLTAVNQQLVLEHNFVGKPLGSGGTRSAANGLAD